MALRSLALDAAIGEVASSQRGLITLDQALELGASAESIWRRARAGSLTRIAPKVFRVVGAPRSWEQRALAAALWVGELGAVTGQAAAALHRLDGAGPPSVIDVLTPRRLKSRNRLLKVHHTPWWLPEDRVHAAGIAVTSVERTLIEMGSRGEQHLEVALEDALRRRLTTTDKISRRLTGLPPNQAGRADVTRLLSVRGGEPPAESALEVKVLRLLRELGLPRPIRQKTLDDNGCFVGRVDLAFPDRRLIIEVDSYCFHEGRAPFDHDRSRLNALHALGWLVMHATSAMLVGPGRDRFARDLKRAYDRPLSAINYV